MPTHLTLRTLRQRSLNTAKPNNALIIHSAPGHQERRMLKKLQWKRCKQMEIKQRTVTVIMCDKREIHCNTSKRSISEGTEPMAKRFFSISIKLCGYISYHADLKISNTLGKGISLAALLHHTYQHALRVSGILGLENECYRSVHKCNTNETSSLHNAYLSTLQK